MSELIDLSKSLKPASDVAICLLNKIERAGAYFLPSKDVRDAEGKAHLSIINEIAARTDINPIERGAIISNYKKLTKEYTNQTDIIKIALEKLKDSAKPENVEDDWLNNFFDKARLVSDDQMKVIWGRVLTNEVNLPNSVSKQLLHILSIMGRKEAESFMRIVPFCFDTSIKREPIAAVVFNYSNDVYKKYGLCFDDIVNLESLNLIQTGVFLEAFSFGENDKITLSYGIREFTIVNLDTYHQITMGDILLTKEAVQLAQICERKYFDDVFEYTKQYYESATTLETKFQRYKIVE